MAFEKELGKMFGKESVSPYYIYLFDDCIYVEGVKRLCVLSENEIVFQTKNAIIVLSGNMKVTDSGKGYIAIAGKVNSAEIKRNDG